MAWPRAPCGRILIRKLRYATCTSRCRDKCDLRELPPFASCNPVDKREQSLHTEIFASYDGESDGWNWRDRICSQRNASPRSPLIVTSGHGGNPRAGTTFTPQDGRRWAGRALDCHSGIQCLHSSSVNSEPPTAAATRASGASVPDDNTVHTASEIGTDKSDATELLQTEDVQTLFSGMTSKELLMYLGNLELVAFEPTVTLSRKVLTSRAMKWPLTSASIFWLVKRTAYSHFCCGEDVAEAGITLRRIGELGLKGALDYGLEDAEDEETCDRNCAGYLKTIQMSTSLPAGSVTFTCVKISAICPISLLRRVSDNLRWQHKNPEYRLPWKHDGLPILTSESPTYHTQSTPEALSSEEETDLVKAQHRFRQLCKASAEVDVPMLVDAEYKSIQPAIDYMTFTATAEFNIGRKPIVYGTLQTYLKDAPARLSLAMSEAAKRNVCLAVKVVRGAYITRETSEANSFGFPTPIHESIEDTHQCYNDCVSAMLNRVASGNSAVVVATHNIDSGRFAAQKVDELGLDRADTRVQFAQLKGMADSLSLALVHAGFNVSKLLPFGPVADVVPYLLRRAEENHGLLGKSLADRQRMRNELWRRLGTAAGLKNFA